MPVPWLIDTDPGIDDALALLLALASPEVSVEAITSVAGNVPVDFTTANVHRILSVGAPAARIRVARGAAAPLRGPLVTAADFHGDDGLGGISALRGPKGQLLYPAEATPAVTRASAVSGDVDGPDLILEMADKFAGELVIVALGPLTNLAVALERDRRRLSRVARVVIMGGAVAVLGERHPVRRIQLPRRSRGRGGRVPIRASARAGAARRHPAGDAPSRRSGRDARARPGADRPVHRRLHEPLVHVRRPARRGRVRAPRPARRRGGAGCRRWSSSSRSTSTSRTRGA